MTESEPKSDPASVPKVIDLCQLPACLLALAHPRMYSETEGQLVGAGESQPRSQGLSSLPPLVVGRKTLVAAGHVTTCDTNYSTGVESTNNFCRSPPAEAKERLSNYYTFDIFQYCCKLHTGQAKHIYIYLAY